MKYVPGVDNHVKGVQCYELFGGIAPKNLANENIYIKTQLISCFSQRRNKRQRLQHGVLYAILSEMQQFNTSSIRVYIPSHVVSALRVNPAFSAYGR